MEFEKGLFFKANKEEGGEDEAAKIEIQEWVEQMSGLVPIWDVPPEYEQWMEDLGLIKDEAKVKKRKKNG